MSSSLTASFERLVAMIGASGPEQRGRVDAVAIERFARASGETDPVYFSDDAARLAGYGGRPAPPLMLSSVLDWAGGPALGDLRADGSGAGRESWLPLDGLRLMGGGQSLTFHHPVLADAGFAGNPRLTDVVLKQGSTGDLILLTILTEFVDTAERPLVSVTETLIGR